MATAAAKPESVMDPTTLSLADTYAEALAGLLSDAEADEIAQELDAVVGLLDNLDGFDNLLSASAMSGRDRRSLVEKTFHGRCSPVMEAFLAVLAGRGRMGLLRAVRRQFRKQLDARQGKVEVAVTAAVELAPAEREGISRAIGEALGAKVLLKTNVDESLIGGVTVLIGDRLYDGSLAAQLKRLARGISRRIADEE